MTLNGISTNDYNNCNSGLKCQKNSYSRYKEEPWKPIFEIEKNEEHFNNNKNLHSKVIDKNSYFLWILTPVAASFSVILVIAALAGPVWLITEERLVTSNYKMNNEEASTFKCTKSSLWIICSAILTNSTNCTIQSIQDVDTYSCVKIDYFPKEEYRADAQDSTSAIPYTIIKSCPFFLTSGVLLVISFTVFLTPTILHQNNLYYFAAGILFVVSGLLMLIGLIVYISIFKSEIGSKLRSKSAFEPPIFRFTYGQSFFLYVFGFISTEFVGVLNIFLYISLLEINYNKEKIPCLPFLKLQAKTKRSSKTCQKLDPQFICKKHAIPINLLFDNELSKRYYFEKIKKIDENSHNLAKSLNELYTEPAPTFSGYDMSLYNGSPLTRSVSTTTEIFLENNKESRKNRENNGKEQTNDMCGLSSEITRGIRKTKNDLVNEFFKRTGVKPKSKNIYFIENTDDDLEDNVFVFDNYSKMKNRHSFKDLHKINLSPTLRNKYEKFHTKSLMSLNQSDPRNLNNNDDHFFSKNSFYDNNLYQSRTLPRTFMKRSLEGSQNYSFPIPNLQYKRDFSGSSTLRKSADDLENLDLKKGKTYNGLTIQWPQAIPASPSYSIKSTNYYNGAPLRYEKLCHHLNSDLNEQKLHTKIIPSFDNNYQIMSFHNNESFDLDQIEKDCRISHASLFNERNYDTINGTAV